MDYTTSKAPIMVHQNINFQDRSMSVQNNSHRYNNNMKSQEFRFVFNSYLEITDVARSAVYMFQRRLSWAKKRKGKAVFDAVF